MAFRFDRFTLKAQEAVQRAQDLASDAGNPQIDPLHLLAALLGEEEGVVRPILDKIGVNRGQLDNIVQSELNHFPKGSGGGPPQPGQSLVQVFEAAQREAGTMKDDFVSTEHLLLALARVDSNAKNTLKLNAVTDRELLEAMRSVRGNQRVSDQNPEASFRRSRNTASIWSSALSKASSIPSSAAIRKSAASSRSFHGAPRTIRC
jgi:ATP-dependent Clp protease ATP-binding subunit ClpB